MTGVVLALGAALGWGIADFIGGNTSRQVAALVVLAASQGVGLAIVVVAALAAGLKEPDPYDLLYAAGSGVALTLGLGALYRAMAVGAMALVSPIAATGAVIPVVVGLAGGDSPSLVQGVGVAAAICGVALCSYQRGSQDFKRAALASGVGLALLAAVGGGLTATALAAASSAGVLWVLLVQRATVGAVALAIILGFGTERRLPRATLPAVAAIGLLDLAATGFFTLAFTHGELSLIAVVGALYPVVTVLLAYMILSERLVRHQVFGVLAALSGVAAIASG